MAVASQARMIDELARKAAKAVGAGRLFEAERLADEAMDMARQNGDFARMAAIVTTLEQSRQQRLELAAAPGRITIMDTPFEENVKIKPGCYLFQPPLVGADARRFRLMAFKKEVPAAVLCREPRISLGLIPLVALGIGGTVRVKVRPPADEQQPGMEWFREGFEALGEAAAEIDPEMQVEKRVDTLLARLAAIPESAELHRSVLDTCREAADRLAADAADA